MRIGFDAVRALRNGTGLGNYARGVLRGLREAGSGADFVLYSPRPPRPAYAALPGELGSRVVLPPRTWRNPGARSLWRTFRLGRRAAQDGVDLYHGLTHEIPRDLPRAGIRSVVSVLDLIWERHPESFPIPDRWSYRWRYRWSIAHADFLVAASEETRNDLMRLLGVEPERIAVIPPAVDPRFASPVPAPERAELLRRHRLPGNFLLSVGTLTERKNQGILIAALARLDPDRTPALVLVGGDGGTGARLVAQAARLGVSERVQVRTEVGAADLPGLVQSAAMLLYPSRYEGFGMPIAEALAAGVPVVASDGGCFREAGGPDSLYADPADPAEWAERIRVVLDDRELAARMRAAGTRHAEAFRPAALARRLLAVYDDVVGGRTISPPEAPCAG